MAEVLKGCIMFWSVPRVCTVPNQMEMDSKWQLANPDSTERKAVILVCVCTLHNTLHTAYHTNTTITTSYSVIMT